MLESNIKVNNNDANDTTIDLSESLQLVFAGVQLRVETYENEVSLVACAEVFQVWCTLYAIAANIFHRWTIITLNMSSQLF